MAGQIGIGLAGFGETEMPMPVHFDIDQHDFRPGVASGATTSFIARYSA